MRLNSPAADRLVGDHRIGEDPKPEHDAEQAQRCEQLRADVVDDALGAVADVLEPDRHGEPDADLQPGLAERAAHQAVDVAAVHEMTDFKVCQQHGEQDRGALHHAAGLIVGAPAQQMPGDPERGRRHAIAVENPIEDRRRADVAADDARFPADARHHQHHDRGSEPAQHRQRPLFGDPGDARHHQGERHREPALFQGEGERQRQRRDRRRSRIARRRRRCPGADRVCPAFRWQSR